MAALQRMWNDRFYRGLFYQIVLGLLLVVLAYVVVINTQRNLDALGRSFGISPACIFQEFFGSDEPDAQESSSAVSDGSAWLCDSGKVSIPDSQTLGVYDVDNPVLDSTWRIYLLGLGNTIRLAIVSIIAATLLGFAVGVLSLSSNLLVRFLTRIYTETLRNIPLIIQILFWFLLFQAVAPTDRNLGLARGESTFLAITQGGVYLPRPFFDNWEGWGIALCLLLAVAASMGLARWARQRMNATGKQEPVGWYILGLFITLPLIFFFIGGGEARMSFPTMGGFRLDESTAFRVDDSFSALFFALVIYTSAFIAEIVRAGILAVPKGQTEASAALGLRQGVITRLIVVPQALRVVIPPLTSQYLNITKNTTLAAVLSYWELQSGWGNTILNQTGRSIEIVMSVMITFLILSLLTSFVMNIYNRRVALRER